MFVARSLEEDGWLASQETSAPSAGLPDKQGQVPRAGQRQLYTAFVCVCALTTSHDETCACTGMETAGSSDLHKAHLLCTFVDFLFVFANTLTPGITT